MTHDRAHAMDHVVLVLFENRSLDNLLGRLYGPCDGKVFEGVAGKELSNPSGASAIPSQPATLRWPRLTTRSPVRPRDPASWPDVEALPVPQLQMDMVQMGKALSTLGKTMGGGLLEHAREAGYAGPPELADPSEPPSAQQILAALRGIAHRFFPRLAADT